MVELDCVAVRAGALDGGGPGPAGMCSVTIFLTRATGAGPAQRHSDKVRSIVQRVRDLVQCGAKIVPNFAHYG